MSETEKAVWIQFACAAIAGRSSEFMRVCGGTADYYSKPENLADEAADIADAMLDTYRERAQ